ncbi:polyisoprenyl-teichoic acid--peptidoglycan teichoic acid transferase TagU [Paraliobacillus ryukyuensis]|uniref:LytR family transcriptional attenuator n=1 Tax=Paraliobacillus ryukyuensis TaxID=200904 RepID=A0A366EGZ4_9BACI|nr:LCP family protein [Paraliobacillus ryukyuensis]RBP00705.1 LytR family transcriptional attenuator [Paraliobacillus ryukyuensis]
MVEERRTAKRKKKKRKGLKITLLIIGIIILGIVAFAVSVLMDARQTVNNEIHQGIDSIDTEVTKEKVRNQQPLNILLLGVDERKNDSGRSDALVVASINPSNESVQLVSIPRDTRAEIVGHGTTEKINHAYAYGGADMSVNTVENFLDIELDYYVKVNMQGLEELVNAVGGITVDNEIAWTDSGYYKKGYDYELGEIDLNGAQALGYVRMRKQDPEGDFGRTKRQRKVIEAIIQKGASVGSVTKISDVLDVLGSNVETNMKFNDMKNLFLNYRNTRKNISTYMLDGHTQMINGASYVIIPDEEIQKFHDMIEK